ncbi:DUF4296 domain-containing protein [Flavobacteriaceae bacterium LMO-SS05]
MKKLFCILICVLFSCNTIEKPKKPDGLISKEKMVDILYDVYLLNSAKGVNKKLLELNGVLPEQYVFEKYNIDSTLFADSNNYYAYDTKAYESILNNIKEKIDSKKKEYEALEKVEEAVRKKKLDSLRAIKIKENDSLLRLGDIKPIRVDRKKIN